MNDAGQKLWLKAKNIIPGGNQLLSKRAELFLPNLWPAYYTKAKGCSIWDLNNNHFYDFAGMGVTACILGYADNSVDKAVKNAIDNGSMSTLNSHEEVELAEKLIEIHPWAEMARFARTGGEACSIAIRIGRASSGKDHIAFCGYHGWHDWYLSANLSESENLNKQLLPGLNTNGVPKELSGTAHPFFYNDIDSFYDVFTKYGESIGTIIMEPQRGLQPQNGFLKKIRDFATKNNIVLIFDEVTSGFHNNLGGLHMTLNVNPDIVIFAKAMGNGFPISAVIGKRSVMDSAQDTFISSTMWTERVGFTAALASIKKMEKYSVQKKLVKYGVKIKKGWEKAANETGLNIDTTSLDSIPYFSFNYKNAIELLTFFNQEMLKRGFLTNAGTATTYAYTPEIINNYLENVTAVFKIIKDFECNVSMSLKGPVKHTTFARLTGSK
jgi:glutamate-1-semialdehyde 2,1-aminomutase